MWSRNQKMIFRLITRQNSVLRPQVLKNDKFLPIWAGVTTLIMTGMILVYKKGKVSILKTMASLISEISPHEYKLIFCCFVGNQRIS
jgi:hypothetical protein